ncbi:MAG: thiamine pyrophosphate-dependent enzyme [Rickettsiales bacterium]|nr:thiamine pyrophosphate-dependent enzyme [Pseudomonadota bacterium]MDA0965612.1 thiamine pyrophosphate-dependent enzyme [Pseudomonadota bacterium]MDG4542936.1 thiamine pyrophosphate-dependent enzyme [Rickettsiales bacterium]MDG4544616.1 thiamine pyrophosphate-dependent enzyme [Rickettsiales bacterium]MDG4546738.1 thiamine pyrophosphate-dependent enzyme [Rickettsiales bacterium]
MLSKNAVIFPINGNIIPNEPKYNKLEKYYYDLHKVMLVSREAENREAILFRQGKGLFHLPGAGHEAIALLKGYLDKNDKIFPHYRDKALMLALGVPLYQLALDYFGKADSSSGGTQMSSHFYAPEYNVLSCATPTALQALPAAGVAWAKKIKGDYSLSICITGEASIRQGEWLEALVFAIQENLPLVLIVEDNGYGVSTPTDKMTLPIMRMIPRDSFNFTEVQDIIATDECFKNAISKARDEQGPQVIWMKCPRIMSHTSSDDQRKYRSSDEMASLKNTDPILALETLIKDHDENYHNELSFIRNDIKEDVQETYLRASQAADPNPSRISNNVLAKECKLECQALPDDREWNMAEAINYTLTNLMKKDPNIFMFGEDIEDPKGGVFGLTKGLSKNFPSRVYNSPLCEATIAGVSSGMSQEGLLPIFELQFVDFSGPALNQIMNQISTLRWRTAGRQSSPLVFLAPCGGYISGGGMWHSQTLESLFAQMPGLRVVMPSNPRQASEAIHRGVEGFDPVVILLPKKQFFRKRCIDEMKHDDILAEGNDITIVSWGNGIELCEEASLLLSSNYKLNCDLICLQSLSPLDLSHVRKSIKKTGRILIVQESTRHCSVGQAIIAELSCDTECWDNLFSPPKLVSRADVHVPFHYETSLSVLPSVEDVCNASRELVSI